MLLSERKPDDTLGGTFRHHQNIVLSVTAGSAETFAFHRHAFHRNHHSRAKFGLDVFAEFQARLSTVVMGRHTEGMAASAGIEAGSSVTLWR